VEQLPKFEAMVFVIGNLHRSSMKFVEDWLVYSSSERDFHFGTSAVFFKTVGDLILLLVLQFAKFMRLTAAVAKTRQLIGRELNSSG
jgi:hypothetical protein